MILGERVTLSVIAEGANFTFSFWYQFCQPFFFYKRVFTGSFFYISFVKHR